MGARAYDPSTGLFLQRDPVAYVDALNLYAGFGWDPVNNRDPTGELIPVLIAGCAANPVCGAAIIGGGIAAYSQLADLAFGSGRVRDNSEIFGGIGVSMAAGAAGGSAGSITTSLIGTSARAFLSGAAAAVTGGMSGGITARVLTGQQVTWETTATDGATGLSAYGLLSLGRINPLRGDPFQTDDAVRSALRSFSDELGASVRAQHPAVGGWTGSAAAAARGTAGTSRLVGANKARIDPRKLTEYALNPTHPVGGNKARVFESALGYNKSNYKGLLEQLHTGMMNNTPVAGKVDAFGARFTVDIPVVGPAGSGTVRTGWIFKPGSNVPDLTTLFVK